jgi:hypothetical protein
LKYLASLALLLAYGLRQVSAEVHASEETVEIFVEADFETHAMAADLLSPVLVSWSKTLSFSILA